MGDYYLNNFVLDQEVIDIMDALGFDVEEIVKNAKGFHLGAGIDFLITENIALNTDFYYF